MKEQCILETPGGISEKDIFYQAYNYNRASLLIQKCIFPYFKQIEDYTPDNTPIIEGKSFIMAGANNYLSLTFDKRIKNAAKKAIDKYGSGCTGSRYLNGTLDIHIKLEKDIAAFMEKEACVLFGTGYQANEGSIQCIARKNDIIFSDKDNHTCAVMGIRLSRAKSIRFKHNDMEHLEHVIANQDPDRSKLIISDGVFSMSGMLANIPKLVEITQKYNARLYIDDAHGIGVLGPKGQGSSSIYGLLDEVDLISGTFSKSFASLGGFIVGKKKIIDYIRHTCPTHIFSASMPPAAVATAQKALEIIIEEPWRLERAVEIGKYMNKQIQAMGFQTLETDSPIVTFTIGDDRKMCHILERHV